MGVEEYYVQNGSFKSKYDAIDYEVACQMAVLDLVEKENWKFAPFIVVSQEGYTQDIINEVDSVEDLSDGIKILLIYNVIRSVAEYVDVGGVEHTAWLELARTVEEATIAYDGGDKYHDLVHELV
jgi:hypothetical protein